MTVGGEGFGVVEGEAAALRLVIQRREKAEETGDGHAQVAKETDDADEDVSDQKHPRYHIAPVYPRVVFAIALRYRRLCVGRYSGGGGEHSGFRVSRCLSYAAGCDV